MSWKGRAINSVAFHAAWGQQARRDHRRERLKIVCKLPRKCEQAHNTRMHLVHGSDVSDQPMHTFVWPSRGLECQI